MAQFIDERNDNPELEDGEELQSFEESAETDQPEEEVESTPEPEQEPEDLPDKYKGKDVKDIIAMHQNAEQLLGKQGQEVGELRRIVDDFIKAQSVNAHSAEEEVTEEDFFANPKEAINKMLDNHPSIKQQQQATVEMQRQATLDKLTAAHPDWQQILGDAKFGQWIRESTIRSRLLKDADTNYDFDAANEILNMWKERQETVKSTVDAEKKTRKEQVKTASSGTSSGSGERPSRKVYRRADIIELMRTDPQRYEDLMPEIRAAYAEGRVK